MTTKVINHPPKSHASWLYKPHSTMTYFHSKHIQKLSYFNLKIVVLLAINMAFFKSFIFIFLLALSSSSVEVGLAARHLLQLPHLPHLPPHPHFPPHHPLPGAPKVSPHPFPKLPSHSVPPTTSIPPITSIPSH